MAETIDFSGEWAVDKARSATTLEPILQCMGLPWLAIQLVLRLDVATEIAHQPGQRQVRTTDRTSLGVLSTNELCSDGVQVARVGKDGRTALLTCCVGGALPEGFEARALTGGGAPPLAYLRITTVLPDGEGVSDNVWEMRGGGRVMQAYTVFTKGSRVARAYRVLVNKAWLPGRVPEALPLPAEVVPAVAAAVAEGELSAAAAAAAATTAPVASAPAALAEVEKGAAEAPLAVPVAALAFPLPQLCQGEALDPFFVSLEGSWVEAERAAGAPAGLVGQALRLAAAGVLAALGGAAAAARSTLTIAHAAAPPPAPAPPCRHLRLAWPSLWGGAAAPALPLDGAWRWHAPPRRAPLLLRAVQAEGQGDLGPAWLGHEVGTLPACLADLPSHARDARVPFFSSAELDARLYAQAEVRIEILAPAAAGGAGVAGGGGGGGAVPPSALPQGLVHTLILRGQGGAGSAPLWLGATAEGAPPSAHGGWSSAYPPSLRWCALARQPGGSGAGSGEAQERARLGGVRAALLLRRAQADRERRQQQQQQQHQAGLEDADAP
jgi:hypothetical protein